MWTVFLDCFWKPPLSTFTFKALKISVTEIGCRSTAIRIDHQLIGISLTLPYLNIYRSCLFTQRHSKVRAPTDLLVSASLPVGMDASTCGHTMHFDCYIQLALYFDFVKFLCARRIVQEMRVESGCQYNIQPIFSKFFSYSPSCWNTDGMRSNWAH